MAINVKDKLVTVESLGIAYSTEQGARQEADQALSTRIDNIVAPDGDPSLTEVSDARVSGSTTHNTLKARLDADQAAIETEISGINESMDDIKTQVGDLSELETSEKSSLVGAINEAAQSGGSEITVDDTLTTAGAAADAKKTGDEISEIKADLADVANHPVKSAEQLISDKRTTDKVPYKYRASQSGKSDRAYDMIVGGTVCFNQLILNGDFSDGTTGFTGNNGSISASNGVLIFTASSGTGRKNFMTGNANTAPDAIVGHKYFYSFYVKVSTTAISGTFSYAPLTNNGSVSKALTANTDTNIIGIRACTQAGKVRFYVYPWGVDSSVTDGTETCSAHDFMIIDLTSMFGTTIADHIYSLEQSQAGAGVALFRQMFQNDYYAYNAGELISVAGLRAHVMRDADNNIIGSYPLDNSLTLRGIPKLVGGKIEFDGDTYEADGTVTRRYAERVYQSGDESLVNAITDGANTVYKLSAPTTKIATPYTSPQVVSPYGTEEYISETVCPVGHITEYPDNLRAKLDGLPWDLSMIAPVEVTYTATRNYTVNQLLIVDNTLYKVTASIANGGTITPNSNVTATTLLADLGDKSNLKTLDKTNIVSAINSLNDIVRIIANRDTSWTGIKENVKSGYGEILYPVGTDFSVSCPSGAPYNDIVFTVVNHRVENGEPIMTLLMKRCIYGIQFDAVQAAFVASEAMAAGTYYFKLLDGYDTGYDGGKYVQFTIVNPLVAGDQIVITWAYNQSWIGKNAYVYHAFDTTPVETCVMSEGQGGTYLGVADGSSANLNHTHRLRYGSNNWKESAVREWLNSDALAGAWQTQQTKFQRPCSYASSKAGFISYLDPSFVAVVRTGTHLNRTNQVFDPLGTKVAYSTEEIFFLLSNEEIGFTSESGIVCGSLFSFYDGANNDDRIKYDIANENTAQTWWLRTPTPSYAYGERCVLSSGALVSTGVFSGYGAAAACEI